MSEQQIKSQDIEIVFNTYELAPNPQWTPNSNSDPFSPAYVERFNVVEDEQGFNKNKSITFTNIIGHQVGQHWVAVLLSNGQTKLFKTDDIKEITVTVKE